MPAKQVVQHLKFGWKLKRYCFADFIKGEVDPQKVNGRVTPAHSPFFYLRFDFLVAGPQDDIIDVHRAWSTSTIVVGAKQELDFLTHKIT